MMMTTAMMMIWYPRFPEWENLWRKVSTDYFVDYFDLSLQHLPYRICFRCGGRRSDSDPQPDFFLPPESCHWKVRGCRFVNWRMTTCLHRAGATWVKPCMLNSAPCSFHFPPTHQTLQASRRWALARADNGHTVRTCRGEDGEIPEGAGLTDRIRTTPQPL